MNLFENTQTTLEEKVEKSKRFIQKVINSKDKDFTSKLILGFSGGKDSCVVYDLVMDIDNSIPCYYANTTIDPKGTVPYIRNNFPNVEILNPKESFYQLVKRKGLPTRMTRFCCDKLKEYVGVAKNMFEGVRSDESQKRQGRDYIQCDSRKSYKGGQHIYPIYDWSEKDVWEYIKIRGIKTNPNYIQNGGCMTRIGCVGCPLAGKYQRMREFEHFPRNLNAVKKAIGIAMETHPHWKLTQCTGGDVDLAIKWWFSNKTLDQFFGENCDKIKTPLFD